MVFIWRLHVCFKCHWTMEQVVYRTANCCIEMYIFVKIFLLKGMFTVTLYFQFVY